MAERENSQMATRDLEVNSGTHHRRGRRWPAVILAISATMAVMLFAGASSASALPTQFWGLNFGSLTDSKADWEAIDRSGAEVYRLNATWSTVAGSAEAVGKTWRDAYGWEQTYDKVVKAAAEKNVTIYADFYGRKHVAANEHQFYESWESEWNEWFEFVWTFVQRYGYGGSFWSTHPGVPYRPIRSWEVWNEPNLTMNNPGGVELRPQRYAEFFVPTANTIRTAQNTVRKAGEPNDTKVVIGGLYQEAGVNNSTVSNFFEQISKNQALSNAFKAAYDGLAIHPYSFAGNETQKLGGALENIQRARTVLNSYGSAAKSLWISELGWPVQGEGLAAGQPAVTASEQASLLRSAFSWIAGASSTLNISFANYFLYQDIPSSAWAYHCGLRKADGSFRPSWWAYLEVTGAPAWPGPTIAFQSSGGQLLAASSAAIVNTGQGMMAGTGPGITAVSSGGYEMAFQANNGQLYTFGTEGNVPWNQGMMAGTSPSIAALSGGGYQVAFQANNSQLYTLSSSGAVSTTGQGMMTGTSPSIVGLVGGGYEMAFQANNGQLYTFGTAGNVPWAQGMKAGTSPSITALPNGGYEVAFQANSGTLVSIGTAGGTSWGQGMKVGTSPSIARTR